MEGFQTVLRSIEKLLRGQPPSRPARAKIELETAAKPADPNDQQGEDNCGGLERTEDQDLLAHGDGLGKRKDEIQECSADEGGQACLPEGLAGPGEHIIDEQSHWHRSTSDSLVAVAG